MWTRDAKIISLNLYSGCQLRGIPYSLDNIDIRLNPDSRWYLHMLRVSLLLVYWMVIYNLQMGSHLFVSFVLKFYCCDGFAVSWWGIRPSECQKQSSSSGHPWIVHFAVNQILRGLAMCGITNFALRRAFECLGNLSVLLWSPGCLNSRGHFNGTSGEVLCYYDTAGSFILKSLG